MIRSLLLAVVTLMLGTEPVLAQFGGQGNAVPAAARPAPAPARNVVRQGMGMMGGGSEEWEVWVGEWADRETSPGVRVQVQTQGEKGLRARCNSAT